MKSLLSSTALFVLGIAAQSAGAQIVNIDATNPAGTSSIFQAGTYSVSVLNLRTPGALYAGWNPYGSGSNCPVGGGVNCAGFTDGFSIGFGPAYTSSFDHYEDGTADGATPYFRTARAAQDHFQSTVDIGQAYVFHNDTTPGTLLPNGIQFTLSGPTLVGFFVNDSYYGDNFGGVSLNVASVSAPGAVPEPATWGLMALGFGMVGLGLRKRRTPRVRVTFA